MSAPFWPEFWQKQDGKIQPEQLDRIWKDYSTRKGWVSSAKEITILSLAKLLNDMNIGLQVTIEKTKGQENEGLLDGITKEARLQLLLNAQKVLAAHLDKKEDWSKNVHQNLDKNKDGFVLEDEFKSGFQESVNDILHNLVWVPPPPPKVNPPEAKPEAKKEEAKKEEDQLPTGFFASGEDIWSHIWSVDYDGKIPESHLVAIWDKYSSSTLGLFGDPTLSVGGLQDLLEDMSRGLKKAIEKKKAAKAQEVPPEGLAAKLLHLSDSLKGKLELTALKVLDEVLEKHLKNKENWSKRLHEALDKNKDSKVDKNEFLKGFHEVIITDLLTAPTPEPEKKEGEKKEDKPETKEEKKEEKKEKDDEVLEDGWFTSGVELWSHIWQHFNGKELTEKQLKTVWSKYSSSTLGFIGEPDLSLSDVEKLLHEATLGLNEALIQVKAKQKDPSAFNALVQNIVDPAKLLFGKIELPVIEKVFTHRHKHTKAWAKRFHQDLDKNKDNKVDEKEFTNEFNTVLIADITSYWATSSSIVEDIDEEDDENGIASLFVSPWLSILQSKDRELEKRLTVKQRDRLWKKYSSKETLFSDEKLLKPDDAASLLSDLADDVQETIKTLEAAKKEEDKSYLEFLKIASQSLTTGLKKKGAWAEKLHNDLDKNKDKKVDRKEFVVGLNDWLNTELKNPSI